MVKGSRQRGTLAAPMEHDPLRYGDYALLCLIQCGQFCLHAIISVRHLYSSTSILLLYH